MLEMRRPTFLPAALLLAVAASARAVCPNGILEPPETCDDGNLVAGDGCSPLCLVEIPNLPPICDGAVATTDALWPPNHKLVPIGIEGVTDPDGDPLAVTITAVAQDEPADAIGDGDTCPDAEGVGTDVVALRSERSGQGDGRVYHVAFRADDPRGGACAGEVEVCVRHDNGKGAVCGDQGPQFDSTRGVCGLDDDCDLDDCLPPPPFVTGSCDGAPLPRVIARRLERARRLLDRAEASPPRLERRLARRAMLQLARVEALAERRLGGDCRFELDDVVERAARCAMCPL